MHDDRADSASGFLDTLGIVGLAFAVVGIGMSDSPPRLRITCLVLSALCLSLSFSGQAKWPLWVRWLLSLLADSLVAYGVGSLLRHA